ncbi:MAG TPA: hypothetical protein VFU21_21170 [Kofleriaceae bacterium]|nr:hypothetical protein [Kofleriaceae bacterium]
MGGARTSWSINLSVVLVLSAACGGGDDGVDLVGDTPEEAADEIADATCEERVDCGDWAVELEIDENGDLASCTPIHSDVDFDECVAENRADALGDLECAMPTDDELGQIGDCINDLIDQDCITEEEVQAYCDALLAGEDMPDEPGEIPASCDALDEILAGCTDDG